MSSVQMKTMLEAGVHFGHPRRRWNPKMSRYIFGLRNGIHILDLQKTAKELKRAQRFCRELASRGGRFLFVGTKRQAQAAVREAAGRCGEFYVANRWLGGTLTNFETIRRTIQRLQDLKQWRDEGILAKLPRQEAQRILREIDSLEKMFPGIQSMTALPQALFVVDPAQEEIAVQEARRLEIPVVAVCDTNCDPEQVDYPIPGNDDAIRAIRLFCDAIADAILEGKQAGPAGGAEPESAEEPVSAPSA